MKSMMDWQDLRLFLAVARHEGLTGAAKATGASPATLGRRMTSLETALNMRLFHRGASGYALTQEGGELLAAAQEMETSAAAIEAWQSGGSANRSVRISGGHWTIRLMTDNLDAYWSSSSQWKPEFLADLKKRDIARRQVDIGVRNARPEEPWLAGRKVGLVRFAVYQKVGAGADLASRWIGLVEDAANSPTGRWLQRHAREDIVVGTNEASHALSLARQGAGRVLLPTFVGRAFPDLEKIGEEIAELETERWLIMHHEERHRPEIRQALTVLRDFFAGDPQIRP